MGHPGAWRQGSYQDCRNTKKKALQSEIREHVLAGSALFTDALKSCEALDELQHEVVDHAVEYVRGEVHINGLENFWSLVKRGLNGASFRSSPSTCSDASMNRPSVTTIAR